MFPFGPLPTLEGLRKPKVLFLSQTADFIRLNYPINPS